MKKTILLVEDNVDDELLVLSAFQKCNIPNEVVVVRDGQQALDYLFGTGSYVGRNLKNIPMLTFLDLSLPKINGIQVLRELRRKEATRAMPVIVLTSSEDQQDRMQSYDLGVNGYMRKTLSFAKFIDSIQQVGAYWLRLNETVVDHLDASIEEMSKRGMCK